MIGTITPGLCGTKAVQIAIEQAEEFYSQGNIVGVWIGNLKCSSDLESKTIQHSAAELLSVPPYLIHVHPELAYTSGQWSGQTLYSIYGIDISFNTQAGFETLDQLDFEALIISCFDQKLVDDYFENINPSQVILATSKHIDGILAAAVLQEVQDTLCPSSPSFQYLDKFAVAPPFKGKGLAEVLFEKLNPEQNNLIWRAKKDNGRALGFYNKVCTGKLNNPQEDYIIYWCGKSLIVGQSSQNLWSSTSDTPNELTEAFYIALDYCAHKPPSLVEL